MVEKSSSVLYKPREYVPVCNSELYFTDLERNGTDTTELRRLQAEYEAKNPPEEPIMKKSVQVSSDPSFVPVRLNIGKNGKIKIKICPEMADLHEKYYSKGIKPKIEERIKALKTFGYPDEVLLSVIADDEKRKKDAPILEEFIKSIFGDFLDKRPTAPKKKNLYQVLKIKKQIYAMPEAPDPEENEISDDEGIYDPED